MSRIIIADGQNDKVLDWITSENIIENKHAKSLENTLETFDFKTFGDMSFSEHLTKRNRVIIPDEDGAWAEFTIFEGAKFHDDTGTLFVEVFTDASYISLERAKAISPTKTEAISAESHVTNALAGTEWQIGTIAFKGVRSLTLDNYTNPYAYIRKVASEFDLELHFRVEVGNYRVIKRYVDLIEKQEVWRGRTIEFGHDLLAIRRVEKTNDIVTALKGVGPERDDGTRLEVFVEDKDALSRWGRNGMHLVDVYEPQSTDQNMTLDRLTTLAENELKKRVNAVIEYEANIADLEYVPGMENKKIRFGDKIKIKDLMFHPPLYLEARVHTVERSITDKSQKKVTLGDYIEYTEEEAKAIWKQLHDEIRKKVSNDELMEYTYKKQEIDTKDNDAREGAKSDVESGKVGLPGGSITDTIAGSHLAIDLGVFGATPQFMSSELWHDGVWVYFNIGDNGNPADKFTFDYFVFRPSKKYLTVDGSVALGTVESGNSYGWLHVILETNSQVIASTRISISVTSNTKDFLLTGEIAGFTSAYLRFRFEQTGGAATGFPGMRTRTLYMHD